MAGLAAKQHGVVGRGQLEALEFSARAIRHRLTRGRLHPVHRGVYAVGHVRLTLRGHWMAAVLAAGEGAVLSHRSAAALHGLRTDNRARTEVTVPARRASRARIQIHVAQIPPDERTVVDGIPVTTSPRTLLDLAAVVPRHRLERAMHEAEYLRLTDRLSLPDLLTRHPHRRGTASVRAALDEKGLGRRVTRSEFEDRFLAFLDERGLPRPDQTNTLIEGYDCDAVWRHARLIVELDGHAAHSTTKKHESDRERDRVLQARGWHTVRVTWRHLHARPDALCDDLTTLLAPVTSFRPAAGATLIA